jgi:hypothetical protein
MLAALVPIPFYVGSLVWQRQLHGRVHRLLLQRSPALHVGSTQILVAAGSMDGISTDPEPFVLQTSLNDVHISYELNASVVDVNQYRETLSAPLDITPCAMATAAQCPHPPPQA